MRARRQQGSIGILPVPTDRKPGIQERKPVAQRVTRNAVLTGTDTDTGTYSS